MALWKAAVLVNPRFSTVLQLWIQPTGGRIQVEGDDLQTFKGKALAEYRGKKVGYLFQKGNSFV